MFVNSNHRVVESGVIPLAIREYRSYRTFEKNSFIRYLKAVDWNILDKADDLDSAVEAWNLLFSDVANKHAPIKKIRIKETQTPWLTTKLKDVMQDHDYHHRKAVKSNSEFHGNTYKKLKCLVNKQVERSKADYYLELINNNKGNSSGLWKTLNEITGRKLTSSVTCIEADGISYTDSKSVAEVLNNHFFSVGFRLADGIKTSLNYIWQSPTLNIKANPENGFDFQSVDEAFACKKLNRLRTNKAIGLDKCTVFEELGRSSSANSNQAVFNRSLQSSKFPSIWKSGKGTALFKSGDRCVAGNYRPNYHLTHSQ